MLGRSLREPVRDQGRAKCLRVLLKFPCEKESEPGGPVDAARLLLRAADVRSARPVRIGPCKPFRLPHLPAVATVRRRRSPQPYARLCCAQSAFIRRSRKYRTIRFLTLRKVWLGEPALAERYAPLIL